MSKSYHKTFVQEIKDSSEIPEMKKSNRATAVYLTQKEGNGKLSDNKASSNRSNNKKTKTRIGNKPMSSKKVLLIMTLGFAAFLTITEALAQFNDKKINTYDKAKRANINYDRVNIDKKLGEELDSVMNRIKDDDDFKQNTLEILRQYNDLQRQTITRKLAPVIKCSENQIGTYTVTKPDGKTYSVIAISEEGKDPNQGVDIEYVFTENGMKKGKKQELDPVLARHVADISKINRAIISLENQEDIDLRGIKMTCEANSVDMQKIGTGVITMGSDGNLTVATIKSNDMADIYRE